MLDAGDDDSELASGVSRLAAPLRVIFARRHHRHSLFRLLQNTKIPDSMPSKDASKRSIMQDPRSLPR
jgi:hypothetical protein